MATTAIPTMSAQEAMQHLANRLDLSGIRFKLADTEEGPGHLPDQLDLLEGEYRRFLALRLMHPGADVVPCKIVDEMWHAHILDTAAYRDDCDRIFGRFLDHYPYFGMNGPEDAQALTDAYADTLDRYHDAFGDPPPDSWITERTDLSRCRTQCRPMRCR